MGRKSGCISPSLPRIRDLSRRSPSSARLFISLTSDIHLCTPSLSSCGRRSLWNIGLFTSARWPFDGAPIEVPESTSCPRTRQQRHRIRGGGSRIFGSYHAWLPQLRCFWDLCAPWLSSPRLSFFRKPFWQYYTGVQEASLRWVSTFWCDRNADVIDIAYHSNYNLRYECPGYTGHLSFHCDSHHKIRTTQFSF